MSIIKVEDIAYVRFGAPDLARMRAFLLDFGLIDAEQSTDSILRMRGSGSSPFIHVTELGETGFRGVALRASSVSDLEKLAAAESARVEPLDAPGGGHMVRLIDPNGFVVDVIAGQSPADKKAGDDNTLWNFATQRPRQSAAKRVRPGAADVVRLGHLVCLVNDLPATWSWWQERFALLISHEVRAPDGNQAALFIRCDRGDLPADHHTLNFASVPGKSAQFHHAAFEVADVDSLMVGHDHLQAKGYEHNWGVGRHILGSQVFDYWLDPFGNRVEHWTDGDIFTSATPPEITDLDTMLGHQWGPPAPASFV